MSKARDRTHNLKVPSWICFHCTMTGTPRVLFYFKKGNGGLSNTW